MSAVAQEHCQGENYWICLFFLSACDEMQAVVDPSANDKVQTTHLCLSTLGLVLISFLGASENVNNNAIAKLVEWVSEWMSGWLVVKERNYFWLMRNREAGSAGLVCSVLEVVEEKIVKGSAFLSFQSDREWETVKSGLCWAVTMKYSTHPLCFSLSFSFTLAFFCCHHFSSFFFLLHTSSFFHSPLSLHSSLLFPLHS